MSNAETRGPRRELEPRYERHHAPAELAARALGHAEPDPQGDRVNFVPGDICIVISTRPGVELGTAYTQVAEILTAAHADARTRFHPKPFLEPSGYVGDNPRGLIGDQQAPYSEHGQGLQPWFVIPPLTDGDDAHALLFYHVDQPGRHAGALALEVFNSINTQSRRGSLPAGPAEWSILGADLNWNHAGAGDHTQGCPASRPEPAPTGDWRFTVPPSLRAPSAAAAAPVLVAVLDTCPEKSLVHAAALNFPDNTLLQQVDTTNPVVLDSSLSLSRGGCTFLDPVTHLPSMESWHLDAHPTPGSNWDDFRMDDHGLFVSGIVRDIAPRAQIELIRVLGDYGVGHSQGVTQVVGGLIARLTAQPGLRLIVNLSLVASIPPDQWELPGAYSAMGLAIRALVARGALVIASAGNEDLGTAYPNLPAAPMFPARMSEVLSVSAINYYDQKSWFADRATLLGSSNGVAVFGGDILPSDGEHHPLINMQPPHHDPVDAAVGIFSTFSRPLPLNIQTNPSMPLNPDRSNGTGWVYWSGASFATPVISAIAANVWAANPTWTAAQVRNYIQNQADLHDPSSKFHAYDGAYRIFVDQAP